jgi:hypothetical protein
MTTEMRIHLRLQKIALDHGREHGRPLPNDEDWSHARRLLEPRLLALAAQNELSSFT